jgi:hypothetical protein
MNTGKLILAGSPSSKTLALRMIQRAITVGCAVICSACRKNFQLSRRWSAVITPAPVARGLDQRR